MKKLIKQLEKIVGCTWVVAEPSELDLYCYDASLDHGNADVVVFPENTLQVAAIIKLAKQAKIPFTPRGAGTGNSGGAVPQRGIVISTVRMRRIISIDPVNRLAVVEPGVINAELSNAISQYRLVFAPDPSSYLVSTLGGNAAENAGGPHCLKYGTTTDHIIALELVTPEGDIAEIGHSCADTPGPDWVGVLVGSEGLLSVITKLTLKLIPRPEEVCNILVGFRGIDEACQFMWSVLDKFTPATMEFMDRTTLGVLRETGKVIYPGDVSFVVLIEVDGYSEEVKRQARDIRDIAKTFKAHPIQIASSDEEREQIWAGRRGVGSALGRSAPARLSNDVCVPRSKLANILKTIELIADKYNLVIPVTGHAGDGNLHPAILLDPTDSDIVERAHAAARDICRTAVELGGTITGEHGVGLEKRFGMEWQFSRAEIELMRKLKNMLDSLGICNPGKMFPEEG